MVAFHVQRGVTVPLSVGEFFAGLSNRFPERDGMYFLPEQVGEYDQQRMKAKQVRQLEIFVRNESERDPVAPSGAGGEATNFQEVHPRFTREITGWEKVRERAVELQRAARRELPLLRRRR